MTLEEYEQALNDQLGGGLLGKRLLAQLSRVASQELGEEVMIEQARISVQDRRLRVIRILRE